MVRRDKKRPLESEELQRDGAAPRERQHRGTMANAKEKKKERGQRKDFILFSSPLNYTPSEME